MIQNYVNNSKRKKKSEQIEMDNSKKRGTMEAHLELPAKKPRKKYVS